MSLVEYWHGRFSSASWSTASKYTQTRSYENTRCYIARAFWQTLRHHITDIRLRYMYNIYVMIPRFDRWHTRVSTYLSINLPTYLTLDAHVHARSPFTYAIRHAPTPWRLAAASMSASATSGIRALAKSVEPLRELDGFAALYRRHIT